MAKFTMEDPQVRQWMDGFMPQILDEVAEVRTTWARKGLLSARVPVVYIERRRELMGIMDPLNINEDENLPEDVKKTVLGTLPFLPKDAEIIVVLAPSSEALHFVPVYGFFDVN